MSVRLKRDSAIRDLSAFYTPATLADVLAQWMVRTGAERILEPSVGGGSLVFAALRQAKRLNAMPALRFTVCDINAAAVQAINPKLGVGSEARSVDFLQLDPLSTGQFDGVLANPPFTRNHRLEPSRRNVLRQRFGINGAAGLWVHFLIHAMEFLRTGGRLASIIPASALFSDYGQDALQRVAKRFASIEVREIADRPLWENGAEERGALLLADGFGLGSSSVSRPTRWSADGELDRFAIPLSDAYERLHALCTPLGAMARLSIGAVTGHNRVFLLDEAHRKALKIRKSDLTPIVSRARHIPGLSIDSADLRKLAQKGEKTWLLSPTKLGKKGHGVRRQLARISASRRRSTLWFSKRTPWWKVDKGEPCDAIFTYMNDRGPRLVLATRDVRCTNTLHYVRFSKDHGRHTHLAASLTLISSFGQLAAERLGRTYGGGVLKFELKDARKLPILPSDADLESAFARSDHALRRGQLDDAIQIADEALLMTLIGPEWEVTAEQFRAETLMRRAIRRGKGAN